MFAKTFGRPSRTPRARAFRIPAFTRSAIRLFIVSGEAATKYQIFCQNLGAAGYFEKPVDFDQLRSRLTAVIQAKKPELRTEARVRLNVILKFQGKDKAGTPLELFTTTENVSASGFLCGCKPHWKRT
jgi:DNA-binding response OmpR family regulator